MGVPFLQTTKTTTTQRENKATIRAKTNNAEQKGANLRPKREDNYDPEHDRLANGDTPCTKAVEELQPPDRDKTARSSSLPTARRPILPARGASPRQ